MSHPKTDSRPNCFRALSAAAIAFVCLGALSACSGGDSAAGLPGMPEGDLDSSTMKAEMTSALAEGDTLNRVTRLVGLVHKLDRGNLEGAVLAHEESLSGLDRDEIRIFANGWARIDPEAALDRVTTWRNPGVTRRAISEIVFYWTLHGGAEEARAYAIASLDRSEDDTETTRNVVLDSVVRGLASAGEYDELTKILEDFPSDRTRTWVTTQAMLQFYREGRPAVRAWVDSIPWDAKNSLKKDTLRSALVTMVSADAEEGSAWFERVEGKLGKGEIVKDFAISWASSDPQAAIEWLRKRPQSANRSAALRSVSFLYLKQNGPEAEAWIQANLDDPLIDTTMRFPLAQYLMSVDFKKALPVAEGIGKKNEKSNALKQILMIWSRTDYDAVKRYMAEVGVPADVEKTIVGQNQIRQQKRARKPAEQG